MRIEYAIGDGSATRSLALTDMDTRNVESLLASPPIREPGFYCGQLSKPGWYYMASLGRLVSYESKFERSLLMERDFAGTVTNVLPQPFRLHFERDSAPYKHVPDFLLRHQDGSFEVVDVKGARARNKPQHRVAFTLTQRACDQLGCAFTVYTEPHMVWKANLEFLAGYRGPLLGPMDQHLPTLVDAFREGNTVGELIDAVASHVPGSAPAVVWRAVWRRLIDVPLIDVPLTLDSPVTLARTHQEAAA